VICPGLKEKVMLFWVLPLGFVVKISMKSGRGVCVCEFQTPPEK
jgi:hypothetical protein